MAFAAGLYIAGSAIATFFSGDWENFLSIALHVSSFADILWWLWL